MFGHIDAPRNKGIYGGNIIVTNYNLSDISVDDIRTKMHTADAGIDGDGGIIGSARADYVDLSNITFTGTNTIGTEYARKNNGGLIGRYIMYHVLMLIMVQDSEKIILLISMDVTYQE